MPKELLHVSPKLELSDSVAIVCSSGKLLNKEYGKLIDSFGDVIRFNRAPTTGYEKYVGSKTTLRVINNHVFNGLVLDIKKWPNQPANFVKKLKNKKILYTAPDYGPWNNRKNLVDESCSCYLFDYSATENLKKKYEHDSKEYLTVGLCAILALIDSQVEVHVFGFDLETSERSHYFEKRPNMSEGHDVTPEQKTMKNLIKNGTIKFY
jgi:hypothetical protein